MVYDFKTVNYILKIKEEFQLKEKYFLLTTILHHSKHRKCKNYFLKIILCKKKIEP
jgi:hypothetical protein